MTFMKNGWLIAGAIVGCMVGAILGACSSTNSGVTTTGTTTHETTSGQSSTTSMTGTGGSTTTTTSTGGSSTTTSSCQSDPKLHQADAGSIYCGFDDAGNNFSCPTGMECCIGGSLGRDAGFAPDECAPWGTACMNPANKGLAVPCEQPSDCAANDGGTGNLCCLMGTTPSQVVGCGAADIKASGGTGTQCVQGATCGAGNTQLCLQSGDCPTGMTCTAFRWKIIEMGFCM
jgi:hypothetical protein